jgi:hypothetical protein
MRRLVVIAAAGAAGLAVASSPALAEREQGQPTSATGTKQAPRLGRTVVVKATDGRVTVKVRHHKRFTLKSATAIPVGSTVDTTHGKVKLTSARKSKGTQSGEFSEGAFVVTQRRSDGLTDVTLTGGDFSVCKAARAAGKPIRAAARRRRSLFGRVRGHGHFRSRGRSNTASASGTDWLTEDRCNGTVTQNKSKNPKSKVDTETHGLHFKLDPGETITYYCNVLKLTPSTYCLILDAEPAYGLIGGGILTTVNTPTYDLCVRAPDGQKGCDSNLPLTDPDEHGLRHAVFACFVRQVGRYVFEWSLDHQNALFPALALTLFKQGPTAECVFRPPRPAPPAT